MSEKFFISKEELDYLYNNLKLSYSQIEKKLNLKRGRIYHWFKKYDIKSNEFFISKQELEKLYLVENLTYKQIEEKLNLKTGVIYHWFKKYNIEARSSSEYMTGRILSDEHKNKISISNSKPHTDERKKNISISHKGKKISEEHKSKIRNKFIGLRIGENHPMWKGGRSIIRNRLRQSFEYKNWRKLVYERDNYTCEICNSNKNYLNCHHIITFASISETEKLHTYEDYLNCDALWDINNGITLCKNCHENIKGREKEFEKTFKDKIYEKNENV